MRFGMILLLLIAVLCVAATVNSSAQIYSSWYFIILFIMLGLNLFLCSVVRVFNLKKQKQALGQKAVRAECSVPADRPADWLKAHHFKQDGDVYYHRSFGFWGAFFTHFAMLLLMISAACVFTLSKTEDIVIFPGRNHVLGDGTVLYLDSFSLKTESGETRYLSRLSALLPDGTEVFGDAEVNHPVKFGQYKIYQQNYAYAAVIGLTTEDVPEEELAWLDQPAFLTLDGINGVYYSQMFGNVQEQNGEVMVSHSNELVNPAYEVRVIDNGKDETGLIYPGTEITAGGVSFFFHEPQAYPGLRVKSQPEWTLWLLYLSFALMLLGLYLCFFYIPEAAHIKTEGLSVVGRKDISDRIDHYREELEENK
jgi:cytochrome c biogenesis protein ResB